nr:uncharacterized protein LOC110078222 [Pogona vitticeps]
MNFTFRSPWEVFREMFGGTDSYAVKKEDDLPWYLRGPLFSISISEDSGVSVTFGPKRSLCFFSLDPKVFNLKHIITRKRSAEKDSEQVEAKDDKELKSADASDEHESIHAERVDSEMLPEYEAMPEHKGHDGCGMKDEYDSADEDYETPEGYKPYDKWNNTCGGYDAGRDEVPYAYPSSSSVYEPPYGCSSYTAYERPSGCKSPLFCAKKNCVYCKYMASAAYKPHIIYEPYESPYGCECSAYECPYDYEFSLPPSEAQYAYETSLEPKSQYTNDNSLYEWQYGCKTSPLYDVHYACKNSPAFETPYEYISSTLYEWPAQSKEVSTPEYEWPPGWNNLQKERGSPPRCNELHDNTESPSADTNNPQDPKESSAGYRTFVGNKEGHSKGAHIKAVPGSTEAGLSPDEQDDNEQGHLPNGIKKQVPDGSDGLLGSVRKFLDGTKRLLCRGNQLFKEQILEEAKSTNGISQFPNISSLPQSRMSHPHGSPVLIDNSSWPKDEKNPCMDRAIQPLHPAGAYWTRGETVPHFPDISSRFLGRLNRGPGRGNFSPLPSHSSCSYTS